MASLNKREACIILFLGPMFSGKTSRSNSEISKLRYRSGSKIAKINYKKDNRYELNASHDGLNAPVVDLEFKIDNLSKTLAKTLITEGYSIVAVDEIQFYTGLQEFVLELHKNNVDVILSGLNSDFTTKMWPNVVSIIPFCTKIKYLHAFCYVKGCSSKAFLNKRIVQSDELELIGGSDEYKAACYEHFVSPYQPQ